MGQRYTHDEWLSWVFRRSQSWAGDEPEKWWALPGEVGLRYLVETFERPQAHLGAMSDTELRNGLWFLADSGGGHQLGPCVDPALPLDQRVHAIRSIATLFRELLALRCTPHLSHIDEAGACEVNVTCYMWWDIAPFSRRSDGLVLSACLDAMEASLAVPQVAVQESALHGLGHLAHDEGANRLERRRIAIIEGFLAGGNGLRPELEAYARAALSGCVL